MVNEWFEVNGDGWWCWLIGDVNVIGCLDFIDTWLLTVSGYENCYLHIDTWWCELWCLTLHGSWYRPTKITTCPFFGNFGGPVIVNDVSYRDGLNHCDRFCSSRWLPANPSHRNRRKVETWVFGGGSHERFNYHPPKWFVFSHEFPCFPMFSYVFPMFSYGLAKVGEDDLLQEEARWCPPGVKWWGCGDQPSKNCLWDVTKTRSVI